MNFNEAINKIQKTKRFQLLTVAGLMLTYPFALIPTLFKVCLDVDEETLEMMFK